jgi:hypothetical protein
VHIDGIENDEEREAPGDAVDNNGLAIIPELVDDRTEEEKVDQGPLGNRSQRSDTWMKGGKCTR